MKMNNFMFNVKQLKMNKFIKYIWQLIISTSNATFEVPSLRPCKDYTDNFKPQEVKMTNKVLREKSNCDVC